jgi:hypothetical protein
MNSKLINYSLLSFLIFLVVSLTVYKGESVLSLPPPEDDIPEEILRTEIILTARSPIDGKPLTAAQYLELQEKIRTGPPPKLSPTIRQNIFLLNILKGLRQLFPFLDI